MTDDVAIEASISPELNEALARLASARGARKATLVREALAAYVRSEQEAAAPVEQGQAAAGAGKPQVDVVRGIRQLLQSKR
jgi:predicted transcriptional regulator